MASQDGSPDDPLIGAFAGSYRIASVLGAGGMGRVYRAEHPELGRSAAVKVLANALTGDPDLVRRFKVEAQAVARLEHPNIVEVLDSGALPDGRPFYTMELLRGESLHGFLARRGREPLPVAALVSILEPVLAALDAAHAAGIVHRDLKPENVFLALRGDGVGYVPKLLDFGVAKLLDVAAGTGSGKTETGSLLGTPVYMSPEQATGQSARIGPASDLYAIGVLAFEMLTGRPPFLAAHLGELIHMHLTQAPPRLRSLRPDAPPELEALLDAALAKAPEDRPASAEEMRRALLAIAAPQQVTLVVPVHTDVALPPTRIARGSVPAAEPGSPGEQQASTVRTRRVLYPTLALLAALAAVAAVATLVARERTVPAPARLPPVVTVVSVPVDAAPPPPLPPDAAPPPADAAPPRRRAAPAGDFDTLVAQARQHASIGEHDAALARAEAALALRPDDDAARFLAGQAACMKDDAALARRHFARLRDAHVRATLDDVCTRFKGIYLTVDSQGSPADRQRRAYELYPQAIDVLISDPARALALAREVIDLLPTHEGGWVVAAGASCRLGKLDDVKKYLARVPARMHDVVRLNCEAAKQPFPPP